MYNKANDSVFSSLTVCSVLQVFSLNYSHSFLACVGTFEGRGSASRPLIMWVDYASRHYADCANIFSAKRYALVALH